MKDETKSKLKKYGKRAGFGVALVSLFLLGVGVGACSARKAVGSCAEDNAPLMSQPRRVAPPLSPSDFPSLDPFDGNLLLNAYGAHCATWFSGSNLNVTIAPEWDCYLVNALPVGRYALVPEGASTWDIRMCTLTSEGFLNALPSFQSDVNSYIPSNSTYRGDVFDVNASPFFFDIPAGYQNLILSLNPSVRVRLVLLTENNYWTDFAPTFAEITLPTDFNPIWLYGDAYKGAVYGMLSTNAEGMSYTASLDVKFFSGGNFYDGIYFEFEHLANTWYQEPTSGQIVLADRNANNYHYPVGMYYRRFGENASVPSANPEAFDCVWSPQWALTNDSEGNTHKYLTPTGSFASDEFRVIDVKEYDASTPVSARWPNLDALALLRLKSSGFIISGDSNLYDAFELLGGAFRSVADILNIQILPFMTLGMLFFIPLIVLVLFAIIRILNK